MENPDDEDVEEFEESNLMHGKVFTMYTMIYQIICWK